MLVPFDLLNSSTLLSINPQELISVYSSILIMNYFQRLRADSIEENLNSSAFIFLKDCLEVKITIFSGYLRVLDLVDK